MAERKTAREAVYCASCYDRIPPAAEQHAKKSYETLEEELKEIRKDSQKKINDLEDERSLLQGHLTTKERYLAEEKEKNTRLREEVEKVVKEFEEFKRDNERERFEAEAETTMLEKTFKECAATKKDVEEICANLLSTQYTSLKKEKAEMNEELLTKMSDVFLEKLKDQLRQNERRCQEDAEECKRIRSDWSKLQAALNSEVCKENQFIAEIQNKQQHIENLQKYCRRTEAERASMAQKIAELEKELLKQQTTQINKRSCMFPEPDIHEDLDIEYGKVVTSFEVLTLVERNFKDSFDAKGFLCDIFMDAYKYCKEFLKEIVCKNIDELFKVQTCETRTDDMEGLSYAFGQLLQYSGIKLELITTQAVSVVKKKVKELAPKLPRFKKATVEPAIETLPLDKFVKLAWKFITQSCPVIVSMPPMLALNEEIHKTSFHHWDEKRREERPLIYAQPVVYRSFHGEVLIKGLVGNF